MLAVPLPFAPNQTCFATVSIYTISHGTTRHGIEYHLHVRPKGNIPPRKTADYMLLTRSKLKKHTESPRQKSHATGTHLCKERAQGTSSRCNEWREERDRICGRLVVEGHQDVACSVCAGIPSADQQMLQGTHAVAQAKDRQVPDLGCYHGTVNAAIPFVMDLISNT